MKLRSTMTDAEFAASLEQMRRVTPMSGVLDRFWAKVNKDGSIPEYAPHLGNCWLWTACKQSAGYGQISVAGRMLYAHRVAYEQIHGVIPDGLTLDHLCRVSLCIRPSHLEAVTHRENVLRGDSPAAWAARQTHCIAGHPFDESNTYRPQNRRERQCRECKRVRTREWRARKRAQHDRHN